MKLIATGNKERSYNQYYEDAQGQQWRVSVWYEMGGYSYFTSTKNERGYYLAVAPVSIGLNAEGRITNESFGLFSGMKKLVKAANRFSDKVLDSLAHLASPDNEDVMRLIEGTNQQRSTQVLRAAHAQS